MESRWSDAEARSTVERYAGRPDVDEALALRVYSARLIGRDPALVLHGGGNTSVKTRLRDDTGELVPVLCVKGSGWDLAEIEPEGHPAVRLESLAKLARLESMSDEAMVNAQRTRLLDAGAPNPSVETLLHAFLPQTYVDHSHADAILALVDQRDAARVCREVYGERLAVVPYVMPGFALAKLAAKVQAEHAQAEGLLLLGHGLFTWGATARESYERHVAAVDAAERAIAGRRKAISSRVVPDVDYAALAPVLRGLLGEGARRYVLELRGGEAARAYADRADLPAISQRGVVTPDHVIRTKRVPLLLDVAEGETSTRDHVASRLAAYRDAYRGYVERGSAARGRKVKALDPDPRIVLVPGLGIVAAGATKKAARVAADVAEHAAKVIVDAEDVGTFEALPEVDLFDMEYWSLEQAKLGSAKPRPLEGQVVYVTGAGRGLGEAIARAFAAAGAHLHLVDREAEPLQVLAKALGASHDVLDVTDEAAVRASVKRAVVHYGGLDGAVSNAGTAPQGAIDAAGDVLRRSFEVNLFAHQAVASAVADVLRAQRTGGFLLFNASKSAFNPGPDFGPYAVPKAALVALMKQYALELAPLGVRANAVNADRIRTGLLPQEDLAKRARARGLEPDAYYRANLLGREVTGADVADAFVFLALAKSTTACVVTVDGGNIAASPR